MTISLIQTVDSNVVQLMCDVHLSSKCTMSRHLKRVNLSHCYQVGDAGVQWIVGSCHSTGITELDLSNTDMTGNCFLRRMTSLRVLKAE